MQKKELAAWFAGFLFLAWLIFLYRASTPQLEKRTLAFLKENGLPSATRVELSKTGDYEWTGYAENPERKRISVRVIGDPFGGYLIYY